MGQMNNIETGQATVITLETSEANTEWANLSSNARAAKEEFYGFFGRKVDARLHRNVEFHTAEEREQILRIGINEIDLEVLRDRIKGDIEYAQQNENHHTAGGTAAYIDRHLQFFPQLHAGILMELDLDSPTLLCDVLAAANGAIQDTGVVGLDNTPFTRALEILQENN